MNWFDLESPRQKVPHVRFWERTIEKPVEIDFVHSDPRPPTKNTGDPTSVSSDLTSDPSLHYTTW